MTISNLRARQPTHTAAVCAPTGTTTTAYAHIASGKKNTATKETRMTELQPEETLLTVAATITENEIATMVSNSELGELIEPYNADSGDSDI